MEADMIELQEITKTYTPKDGPPVPALSRVSLKLDRGEFLAVVGSSGSGKSTLMNVLGLLDRPSQGSYRFDDEDVSRLSADEQARWRNRRFGFVFQAFRLLPRATALENVELPLLYSDRDKIDSLAGAALASVGLAERRDHRATEMSGGQQQRVAIARALVTSPDVILADEPTGNLDARSALEIMALLQTLHRAGRTIVVVTHDVSMAEHCRRIVRLERGRIVADDRVVEPRDAARALADFATPDALTETA
jgi:putative ABC transport system ATP-binding protein